MTSCSARRGCSHKHRSHKHRSHSLCPLSVPGAGQRRSGGQRPPAAVWTLSSLSLLMAGGLELMIFKVCFQCKPFSDRPQNEGAGPAGFPTQQKAHRCHSALGAQ